MDDEKKLNDNICMLVLGRRGKKNDHGKESMQKIEVTTGKRIACAHARKHAQRKETTGRRTTHVWEKYLT
jgi:hypothetical protein